MGKGTKKKQRDSTTSSGIRRGARLRRNIRRAKMKVNRWKRYQSEERVASPKRKGWDTAKLEKHIEYLTSLLK